MKPSQLIIVVAVILLAALAAFGGFLLGSRPAGGGPAAPPAGADRSAPAGAEVGQPATTNRQARTPSARTPSRGGHRATGSRQAASEAQRKIEEVERRAREAEVEAMNESIAPDRQAREQFTGTSWQIAGTQVELGEDGMLSIDGTPGGSWSVDQGKLEVRSAEGVVLTQARVQEGQLVGEDGEPIPQAEGK